jgi:hypothetical protein
MWKRMFYEKNPKECAHIPWCNAGHFCFCDYGGLQTNFFVRVIIFFSFLNKPAHTKTNIILYWVHNTVFSDPWLLLLLAISLIYPSDSPMRFSDISTLNTRNVLWNKKSHWKPVKSQRSNLYESSAFMWSHHNENLRQAGECYRADVPRQTSLQFLYTALSKTGNCFNLLWSRRVSNNGG